MSPPADQPAETRSRFRRSTAVKRQVMKNSFAGNFLDKKFKLDRPLKTKEEISRFLLEMSLQDLGGTPITESAPETDDVIARAMASEVIAAVNRDGHANAQHWYSDSIRKAIDIAALMQPEILDDAEIAKHPKSGFRSADDAKTVLFVAMAVTSQNIPVKENMRYAFEQYRSFLKNGRFDPKGYGTKGASVKNNLERFNQLLKVFDGDISMIRRFLGTEFTMAEVTKAAAKVGMTINGREMVDEPVFGSIIFGAKIGNGFYSNLTGRFDVITIDLWFQRTWGRYTGTLMKDSLSLKQVERLAEGLGKDRAIADAMRRTGDWIEPRTFVDMENDELLDHARKANRLWEQTRRSLIDQGSDNAQVSARKADLDWPNAADAIIKTVGAPVDAPASKSQRRWIRAVANRAIEILKVNGYDLSIAELQALLWIPEKALYQVLSGKKVKVNTVSYDQALALIARKEGIHDDRIAAAIHAVDQERSRGRRYPEAAGEREPRAVRRNGPGTDADFGAALSAEERLEFVTGPAVPASPGAAETVPRAVRPGPRPGLADAPADRNESLDTVDEDFQAEPTVRFR